jgi:hypothetical protein
MADPAASLSSTGFDPSILAPERNLMSGLGAQAQALPGIDTTARDRALAAATNPKSPNLQPLIQERAKLADAASQAAKIEAEGQQVLGQAKQKLQNAENQNYATQLKKLSDDFAATEKSAPELHPTKENMSVLTGLFSLMGVIGTAIGGRGRLSSMGALQSMTGMMKGWQQGNQQEWDRNLKEFDKQVQDFRARIDDANRKYQMGFQMLAADREAGKARMDEALAELGSPLLKATRDRQGYENAGKTLDQLTRSAEKVAQESGADRRAQLPARTTPMFKQVEVTMKDGTKTPAVFEEHSGRYVDLNGNALDTGNIKNITDVGTGVGKGQFQQLMIAQRTITALRGAASATESIMQLPAKSRVGMLAFLNDRDGMIQYLRDSSGRTISAEEAKEMDTLYTGVSRYLAQIESSGAATGLANLTTSMEKLKPMKGDTVRSAALKIADIRRISTEATQALIESGLLPEQMTTAAAEQVARMERAIPFTTNDVVAATTKGKKTFGKESEEAVFKSKPQTYSDPDKEARYQQWLKDHPQG